MRKILSCNEHYEIHKYTAKNATLVLASTIHSERGLKTIIFEGVEDIILSKKITSPTIYLINMAEKFSYPHYLNISYNKYKSLFKLESEKGTSYIVASRCRFS